jgi:hypothetical protein
LRSPAARSSSREATVSERRCLLVLAAAWLALGLAAYWTILAVGFLGDDWMFLDLISRAKDASVLFAPLNLRYTRPLIVLVYYLNFHQFGVWPLPAHLIVVLLHVFNAWLVSALVLRIAAPPNRVIAAGAGLLFLLFAGHSEAVAWVAGMADAAIVPFVIGSLLLFDRALRSDRPAGWITLGAAVGLTGILAKETTAVVLPPLAFGFGLVPRASVPARRRIVLTVIFLALLVLGCGTYLYVRTLRFGPTSSTMIGMGTSEGQRVAVARMFMVRAFAPAGWPATMLWVTGRDRWLLAACALAALAIAAFRRGDRGGLLFVLFAFFVAIAPALPFSISLAANLTERYLYLATVFSMILVAWLIVRLLPVRVAAVAVLVAAAGWQWFYLARSNATWVREDQVFRSIVSGVAEAAERHGSPDTTATVLLNVPDTIYRGCVDAAGLPTALRLGGAMRDPEGQLRMIAVHQSPANAGPVSVQRRGSVFDVDLGDGALIEPPCLLRTTPEYTAEADGAHRLRVRMLPMARRAIIVYASENSVREAGVLPGHPVGSVDTPANEIACSGDAARLSGWAIDDEEGLAVRIERETPGAEAWTAIGDALWQSGTRPDITTLYHGYPGSGPAWQFDVPCAALSARGAAVRVRAIARDVSGQEVELGIRTVRRS